MDVGPRQRSTAMRQVVFAAMHLMSVCPSQPQDVLVPDGRYDLETYGAWEDFCCGMQVI